MALLAVGLATLAGAPALAQRLDLPPRPADAPTGSEFASSIAGLDLPTREARIVVEILRGNVPQAHRELAPIRIVTDEGDIVFWTTPDYLAIGSDADWIHTPMTPQSAQRIADALGMSLPTPRMVDSIWEQADIRLAPSPIPPSPEMTTIPVFALHSRTVQARRSGETNGLVAGHKKDVVVSRDLASQPGRVAIYGWHQLDGSPIQPLYLGHTADWVDYSHGIRLVSRQVQVGDESRDLWDVLRDAELASALSDEGVLELPWFARTP